MDGVWRMLNQDIYNKDYSGIPNEYVFSSNETHSIREFVEKSFNYIKLDCSWENETNNPEDEKLVACINGIKKTLVIINKKFYRPAEVETLLGDSSLARKDLGWFPKCNFDQLVNKMLKSDIEKLSVEKA
jgi:GDPmannose 4,6-dehydratase